MYFLTGTSTQEHHSRTRGSGQRLAEYGQGKNCRRQHEEG